MSFSWYFHSFSISNLKNNIVKGKGDYHTDDGNFKISPEVKTELKRAHFDYNNLAEKYW